MKKKFWLYQNAAICCALLSFFVTPIMVYFNYLLLDSENIILENIESNFKWSLVVYVFLIVGALLFAVKSAFLAKKENKKSLYAFIGIFLSVLSLLAYGNHYVGIFLAF